MNGLSHGSAPARVLRIADGPDEVHNRQVARMEYGRYEAPRARAAAAGDGA